MKKLETECLVIGSGVSGCLYALKALDQGLKVTMVSNEENPLESNSFYAQGGVVYDAAEELNLLRRDIEQATNFLANPESLEILLKEGPKVIREVLLDRVNVPFDRDDQDNLRFTKEAAHSDARIVYCKDTTGATILKSLHQALKDHPNLRILTKSMAVDLLTLSHSSKNPFDKYKPLTCLGAYFLDTESSEVFAVQSKKTILATGGLGQIFLNSTNAPNAYGHGIAMAYRSGARVMDMEYIQFHPTAFYTKNRKRSFLISEALRGEGGILVNADKEPFMQKYHPEGSLAPRDIISRSIHNEMTISGNPCAYLDMSALSAEYIKERFPRIYEQCLNWGVDITKDPIPVAPAAHYFLGGIHATMSGKTNIQNLRAIGETACTGLHGSNRLASTSLLECMVMGSLAASEDAVEISENEFSFPEIKDWISPNARPDEDLIKQDLMLIKNTMWNYCGLLRSGKRLNRAHSLLLELKSEIDEFYANCTLTKELLNLRNAIQTSLLVIYAASKNKKSSGCHFREEGLDDKQAHLSRPFPR